MTENNQIYRCSICGNIVEVLNAGVGQLVCCEKPIDLLDGKIEDIGREKHVPVIEKTDTGVIVKVGSVAHPMEDKHYIQFIELIVNGAVYRRDLKPGEKPEAEFCVELGEDDNLIAREYCNIHGLWKTN